MSIKPLDFQVMIPKTSEVSKIHNDEMNKNNTNLQQQATTVSHDAQKNLKQVNSREKAQEGKIRERQERNKKEGSSGGGEKELEKKDKGKKSGQKTSTIDIRL